MAVKVKKKSAEERKSLIDFDETPASKLFTEELRVMSAAAVGVVLVRTREFYRAVYSLYEFAVSKDNTDFHVWTVTDGWKKLSTSKTQPSQLSDALPKPEETEEAFVYDPYPKGDGDGAADPSKALKVLLKRVGEQETERSVNVMFAPDFWFDQPGFQEYIRQFVVRAFDVDARLILVAHETTEIPERLFEEVKVIDYAAPNAVELYSYVEDTFDELDLGDEKVDVTLNEDQKERLVQNGLGMSQQEFMSALSIGIVRQDEALRDGEPPDMDLLVTTILEIKVELIKKSQTLEMVKPIDISKVGGMDLIKQWIEERKSAFTAAARDYGLDIPKGILAVGPPGTGKSLLAKAVASVLGLPLVLFDIGKVFGGLVGQSEGQMRATLKMIDAMSPVVLLIDEIDKGFSNTSGGGDSGTSARVFGTFLTWMQERKNENKPVFVVMTANNIEGLPPELTRKGRLDEIFAVTYPSIEERVSILRIHLDMRGHNELSPEELREVAAACDQFVGAEIEAVVKDGLLAAFNAKEDKVTAHRLIGVANKIRPLAKVYPDRMKAMAKWAEDNAKPSSSYTDRGQSEARAAAIRENPGKAPLKIGSRKKIVRPSRFSSDD